jgi:hypothetical protein
MKIWFVVGDPDRDMPNLWQTKMDAEKFARELFPEEPEDKRYARIRYAVVIDYEGVGFHIHTPATKTEGKAAKFYHFSQNNSGGSFNISEALAHHVIIEAHSAEDANNKALSIGLYFNGCEDGGDCPCCGDRWYEQNNDDDGKDTPMIFDEQPETYEDFFTRTGEPVCHVYHLDGSKTTYKKGEMK